MKVKKLNKKSGFTLLEIIVVIIIVGVLASLALPRFFSTVEFSRSTEALSALGTIRESVIRCAMVTDDVGGCNSPASYGAIVFADIDVSDPGAVAGAHFGYTINSTAKDSYVITAKRNTVDGGNSGDTILLTVTSGLVSRSGTGAFGGIK